MTGKYVYPPQGRCWALGQDQMFTAMNQWCKYELRDLHDDKERAEICGVSTEEVRKDVLAIVLSDKLEVAREESTKKYKGVLPDFFFSKKGEGTLSRKAYINQVSGRPVTNFWSFEETGHTDEASRLLKVLFDGVADFDTPKPPRLIERILHIIGDTDAVILDSFAGSGTTAHAVLNMNKVDGGNRRFILIEMEDYADSITAERVKRVIHGYGEGKNAVEGTGGDFCFYELSERLMLDNGAINPGMDIQNIRNYIWYTETKKSLPDMEQDDNKYFLAADGDVAYYFCYEKDAVTTLDRSFLRTIKTKAESYIIYADQCAV